ncbi:copper chaperone PCu(A)C [Bauldia litoralis]|uniref:Copper(I)-binding protein n=1 Tax=Bauldia litoralis TaxID=665467 RepID=A0A1G6C5W6_9HYPH|nr:copper chaperone PCu(A)C [Bauldia litoralis]SDB28263.1 hypothetical protein SAMN02982931_02099 [Bauldia litoralis]
MSFHMILAAVAVSVSLVAPAAAHEVTLGSLTLTELWSRATPPNAPTAGGYLTITNTGDTADRLVAVSTAQAGKSEIHEMTVSDGVMTMRPLAEGVEVPANGTLVLAPGGFHLMFMKLQAPFVEGEEVPVTLTFEQAGSVDTFLHVMQIGARGPDGHAGHDDMKMDMSE